MKNKLRTVLIILLSVTAIVFASLGLAACNTDTNKLERIRIVTPITEFRVGDEFEFGEDFAVYAVYSDGTEKDVTAEVTYKTEAGFDMNVAGDYQITVSWGGKKEIYTIYVNAFDNILRKIELNTTAVKKEYDLGDKVDLTGLEVTSTYENAQGASVITKTTNLRNFTVTIVGEDGSVVTDIFNGLGEFTVTLSVGNVKSSFKVNVSKVNISTVQGAISAGTAFSGKVVSGTHVISTAQPYAEVPDEHISYKFTYEYGINYTYICETENYGKEEYHMSMEKNGFFCVKLVNGKMEAAPSVNEEMINGSPYHMWYHRSFGYGIENALAVLYRAAQECTNNDLEERVDEQNKKFSFKFSGLVFISNASDYYETEVSFELADDYSVKHAEYVQKYWEKSNLSNTFVTDESGHTSPITNYNELDREVVDQVTGTRTATNPYSAKDYTIESYDLSYEGRVLGDDGVVDCNTGDSFAITISNIKPSGANFSQDSLFFNYEGNLYGFVDSLNFIDFEGFTAYRSGNSLLITIRNGGVWKLLLKTSQTYKTVTFNVTGKAPTSMTAQIYNSITGKFAAATQKAIGLGGAVYFKGAVNQYANDAQTATVTSPNASSATIEETTQNGVKCFKFSATEGGTYTVTVVSDVAESVKCTFTFTVSEMPDYDSILTGTYTVTDLEGFVYKVEFTPSGKGDTANGTVVITKTPTTESGELIEDQAQTQTLSYSVDAGTLKIVLTHISGVQLGVDFLLNEQNKLVIEDQYGKTYELTKVN